MVSQNVKQTINIASKFAKSIKAPCIILLEGDLGAGKTHFVKGFAKGLGSKMLVTSPTFTLLNVYDDGKYPIYHFDMYRLSSKEEGEELGFNEYFDLKTLDGVVLVEWPEQVDGLINCPHIEVRIEKLEGDMRKIIVGSKS